MGIAHPLRLPAEWEAHAATWVAWPHNAETWPGCLEGAERELSDLVRAIATSEPVRVLVQDEDHADEVRRHLGPEVAVELHVVPTDDAWLRDTGPTFVVDRRRRLVAIDWTFNAWGGRYPPWERDDAVASAVGRLAGAEVVRLGLVVEGGALEVDGAGTLLAVRPTLVDPNRNPGLPAEEIEKRLSELLGVTRLIWLPGGIEADDTDGHVDAVARFVGSGRVVCAVERDPTHPNHAPLEACRAVLREARDAGGRPLEVIDLPMPPPIEAEGERLPASYVNFYISNGAVLVPRFGVPTDELALGRLAELFPRRQVVGIPSRTLVRGLGSLHCLTHQQPQT